MPLVGLGDVRIERVGRKTRRGLCRQMCDGVRARDEDSTVGCGRKDLQDDRWMILPRVGRGGMGWVGLNAKDALEHHCYAGLYLARMAIARGDARSLCSMTSLWLRGGGVRFFFAT
jgi:hypothetical protein